MVCVFVCSLLEKTTSWFLGSWFLGSWLMVNGFSACGFLDVGVLVSRFVVP